MRFKSQQRQSRMPDLNLVPMMDVIMTILTFFIIISMTLTNQKSVNISLPSTKGGGSELKQPDPLVIGLDAQGQILLKGQPVVQEQLSQPIQAYLAANPTGAVVLKADKQLSYEQVVKLLGFLRDIGGDRVSLAIES